MIAYSEISAGADKVDDYIKSIMQSRTIPGLSLAIVQNGKAIKVKGYGLLNIEEKKPASADTIFDIGSVSKPFTACAIMQLAERGKLNIDDPITRYFADLPAPWKGITIRHLLLHTSGIKDYQTEIPLSEEAEPKDLTPTDYMRKAESVPLNFRPGEKWSYSHTNFLLLGMIIESASGMRFSDYIAKRLLNPLEMTSSYVRGARAKTGEMAMGYKLKGADLQPVERENRRFADNYLASSARDMAKFAEALDTGTFLTASSRQSMWTAGKLKNGTPVITGLGWYVETVGTHRAIGHGGEVGGFSSNMTRFPDDKLTIVVLTNRSEINAFELVKSIAQFFSPGLNRK